MASVVAKMRPPISVLHPLTCKYILLATQNNKTTELGLLHTLVNPSFSIHGMTAKLTPERKYILERGQARHRLARDRPVAVDDIRQADRLHRTDHAVRDSGATDGDCPAEMVAVARTPHDEASGAHCEGQEEAPEAVLGLEVAASALRDGSDDPAADGVAVEKQPTKAPIRLAMLMLPTANSLKLYKGGR